MAAILALAGAAVAAVFATRLLGRFRQRRRPHTLAWGASLLAYAIGMVALGVGLSVGWSAEVYGLYWFTGALVNVPLLAVGELHLLAPARASWWWAVASAAVTVALLALVVSTFDAAALAAASAGGGIPLGADVFGDQPAALVLAPLTLTGTMIVVGGTVWSAMRRRRPAVLLIALGVVVAAMSSAFVRAGLDVLVPVALTGGVTIMYAGFRAAAPRRAVLPGVGAHPTS